MELKDLTGKKMLEGVDFQDIEVKKYDDSMESCNSCRFMLDGVVYAAVEDPDDGYRSYMEYLKVVEGEAISNKFLPQEVLCIHSSIINGDEPDDILTLIDTGTGSIVLRVGTDHTDSYYPYYVGEFNPEAMTINQPTEKTI